MSCNLTNNFSVCLTDSILLIFSLTGCCQPTGKTIT